MLLKHPFRREAAEVGDGGNREIGPGEKFQNALQPDVDDFVERRMAHRLAETQIEKLARSREAPRKIRRGKAVACLAADHLDRFQDARPSPVSMKAILAFLTRKVKYFLRLSLVAVDDVPFRVAPIRDENAIEQLVWRLPGLGDGGDRSRRRYSGIATLTRKKRVAPLVEDQDSSSSVSLPSTR